MSVHDGFFDAKIIENQLSPDGSQKYDRAYDSNDYSQYFADIIGSGVCITESENSCKVSISGLRVSVNVGYLFIRGHWMHIKDEPYVITLQNNTQKAIAATLITNTGTGERTIKLEAIDTATSYPADTLIIAIVNPASNSVQDTRYDTTICGVIDSAGGMSTKIQYALNYINNQAPAQFKAIETEISTKEAQIKKQISDTESSTIAKIESVETQIKSSDFPIGAIRFSAANLADNWLLCDGRVISKNEYPELTRLLLNYTASGDEFDPSAFYWTEFTAPNSGCMAYGNGAFIILGDSKVSLSKDGKSWEQSDVVENSLRRSLTYGNGMFVSVGGSSSSNAGFSEWSIDGKNWTSSELPFKTSWSSVAYGNGVFVAVSTWLTSGAFSNNGKTWSSFKLPEAGTWNKVAFGNGIFVAVSGGEVEAYGSGERSDVAAWSDDGITWHESKLPSKHDWTGIAFGNGIFVATSKHIAYSSGSSYTRGSNASAWSVDGKSWNASEMPSTQNWSNVSYGNGLFVAISSDTQSSSFVIKHSNISAWSIDGKSWVESTFTREGNWDSIVFGNGIFIAKSKEMLELNEPFGNVRLPQLSMSNIPAYIKAKEAYG